ncbi:hypothetical protein D9V32_05605 [Mycetocola tolaasinivorans]|uniref:Uncharacterized protein n=1 Tax=Mycetocola tolaasinivorans TaxID=76635 RepID=A0A3L7A7K6_9MICO|nr:hypothetical protein [Mycetocola tolaasinivorans]RLP76346.1 hypothetical protein D9V32_05605 [Mycetocola tolaasinivorans]
MTQTPTTAKVRVNPFVTALWTITIGALVLGAILFFVGQGATSLAAASVGGFGSSLFGIGVIAAIALLAVAAVRWTPND